MGSSQKKIPVTTKRMKKNQYRSHQENINQNYRETSSYSRQNDYYKNKTKDQKQKLGEEILRKCCQDCNLVQKLGRTIGRFLLKNKNVDLHIIWLAHFWVYIQELRSACQRDTRTLFLLWRYSQQLTCGLCPGAHQQIRR